MTSLVVLCSCPYRGPKLSRRLPSSGCLGDCHQQQKPLAIFLEDGATIAIVAAKEDIGPLLLLIMAARHAVRALGAASASSTIANAPASAQQMYDQPVSAIEVIPEGEFTEQDDAAEVLAGACDRMRADMRFSRTSAAITLLVSTEVSVGSGVFCSGASSSSARQVRMPCRGRRSITSSRSFGVFCDSP